MPILKPEDEKRFSEAMERAKTAFKEKVQAGGSLIDIKKAMDNHPDINPYSFYYNASDVEFADRKKQIVLNSTMNIIKKPIGAIDILYQNDKKFGFAQQNRGCQLTILDYIEKESRAKGDHIVGGIVANMRGNLLNNKSENQKKYEDTFTALEQLCDIKPPEGTKLLENPESYLESVFPKPMKAPDLNEEEAVIDNETLRTNMFDMFSQNASSIMSELSKMSESEAMQRTANCAMAESNRFLGTLAEQTHEVAPDFDWSKAVFVNGQPLDERVKEVMDEKKLDPSSRALVTASVLSSTLADKDSRVDYFPFDPETKKLKSEPKKVLPDAGFNKVDEIKDPKMNLWQRYWAMFGLYKNLTRQRKEFNYQKSLGKKAEPLNKEIEAEKKAVAAKLNLSEITKEAGIGHDLGDLVYEKMPENGKQGLTDNDRFMASGMLVAELMIKQNMPLERALDSKLNVLEKEDACEKIADLIDSKDNKGWCDLVMPGAELLLQNKPKIDFTAGPIGAGADLKSVAFQGKYLEQLANNMDLKKDDVKKWLTAHPDSFPAFHDATVDQKFEKLHDIVNLTSKLYNGMTDGYVMIAKDAPSDYQKLNAEDLSHATDLSRALLVKCVANSEDGKKLNELKDMTLLETATVDKLLKTSTAISSSVTHTQQADQKVDHIEARSIAKLEKDLAKPDVHLEVENRSKERNVSDLSVKCTYTAQELEEKKEQVTNIASLNLQKAAEPQKAEKAAEVQKVAEEQKELEKPTQKQQKAATGRAR